MSAVEGLGQRVIAGRPVMPTPTDWAAAVRLSSCEFQARWSASGLGDTPLSLELRPPGDTPTRRRRIYAAALGETRRRGVAHRPGAVLADALRLLAGAPTEWELRLSGGLVAIGVADGERGLVVVRDGSGLALLAVPGPRAAAVLVELIGPLTPGRVRRVDIPADVLDEARRAAAGGSLWNLADRLVERGVEREDADSLARMCTGITVAGQLGGLTRRGGTEHRTPWVIGFHKAEVGDFVQLRRPGGMGGGTVTVAPVTTEQLVTQVRGLVAVGG